MDCYPNPFHGTMTISLPKDTSRQRITDLRIFDIKGRLVFKTDTPENDTFTWNGKDVTGRQVSSGVYILQATDSSNQKHLAKIVKFK